MTTLSPTVKKALSAAAVAAAGAVLVVLNQYVVKLPELYQGFAGALLVAAAHYVAAWGTKEEVINKLVEGK